MKSCKISEKNYQKEIGGKHSENLKKTGGKVKKGFTLVEISLATALIAILLLAVAMIVVNVVSIYRKGMTMKTINSVGRTLVEDFNTTISSSSPGKIVADETDVAANSTTKVFATYYYRNYEAANDNQTPRGAFCLGGYSYLWQTYGDRMKSLKLKYLNTSGIQTEVSGFRLLKISDPYQDVCTTFADDTTTIDLTGRSAIQEPEELLAETDIQLVVYGLSVSPVDDTTGLNQATDTGSNQVLFSGIITLGTVTGIETSGNTGEVDNLYLDSEACDVSQANMDGNVSTFDYCAVNRFKFTAQAGGRRGAGTL